jgi:GNAT superfamily N-acetyltransferase
VRPRGLELRAPRSSGEWARYHDIRKRCIFEKYNGKGSQCYCEYDPGFPDEHEPVNHPLIFLADGRVIGTIRIDIRLEQRTAVFRLVAIDDPWRGQGLGTIMLDMAEAFALRHGIHRICLNSVRDAYGFYIRRGFHPARWAGCTRNSAETPVVKALTLPSMQLVAQSHPLGGTAGALCRAGEAAA